jgi:hypothetical protein
MMKKKYKRKKGPVRSKKVIFDGIKFASGLERYMYQALKKAKIKAEYEGQTYVLQEAFTFECKGRANESFPIRWKMFKNYVNQNLKHVTLYKPQNQKECDKVVELIKNNK